MPTPQSNKAQILAAFALAAAAAISGSADYYLDKDVHIGPLALTQSEYNQLRPVLAERINQMNELPLTQEEAQIWIAAANYEVEKCGGFELTNEQAQNPIPVFNNVLANGCP